MSADEYNPPPYEVCDKCDLRHDYGKCAAPERTLPGTTTYGVSDGEGMPLVSPEPDIEGLLDAVVNEILTLPAELKYWPADSPHRAALLSAISSLRERATKAEEREREALDAHLASFHALCEVSLLVNSGEVDDYSEIPKLVAAQLSASSAVVETAKEHLAKAREYLSVSRKSILSRAVRGDIESRLDFAADCVGKAQDALAALPSDTRRGRR